MDCRRAQATVSAGLQAVLPRIQPLAFGRGRTDRQRPEIERPSAPCRRGPVRNGGRCAPSKACRPKLLSWRKKLRVFPAAFRGKSLRQQPHAVRWSYAVDGYWRTAQTRLGLPRSTNVQEEFCRWWRQHVRRQNWKGRDTEISESEISLTAEQAAHHTGISPVQVSRWNKRLKGAIRSGAGTARPPVGERVPCRAVSSDIGLSPRPEDAGEPAFLCDIGCCDARHGFAAHSIVSSFRLKPADLFTSV